MKAILGIKFPRIDKPTSRLPTIRRCLASTLLKREEFNEKDAETWLSFFPEKKCAYCGKPADNLDHLRPLCKSKKLTGYCTEPANLVPCCSKCNQRKGNKEWEEYMEILKTEGNDPNIQERIDKLMEFQEKMPPQVAANLEELNAVIDGIMKEVEEHLNEAEMKATELQDRVVYRRPTDLEENK